MNNKGVLNLSLEQTIGLVLVVMLIIGSTIMYTTLAGVLKEDDTASISFYNHYFEYKTLLLDKNLASCYFTGSLGSWFFTSFNPAQEITVISRGNTQQFVDVKPPVECTNTNCVCICEDAKCDTKKICRSTKEDLTYYSDKSFSISGMKSFNAIIENKNGEISLALSEDSKNSSGENAPHCSLLN